MADYKFTTEDFVCLDRGILGFLLAQKRIRSINSLKVFLALLSLCQYSVTYTEGARQPKATIVNNGQLRLTARDAYEKFDMHKSTFYAAIADLVEKGFIMKTGVGKGAGNLYAICNLELYQVYRNRIDREFDTLISAIRTRRA